MQSLIMMSVGPVQDFIATARRSQDLWYGSRMLSDLARTAALSLQELAGEEALVFPGALAEAAAGVALGDVANKVVALVPGDVAAARGMAERAERAVREQLAGDAKRVLGRVAQALQRRGEYLLEDRAFAQLQEMLELSWVAVGVAPGQYAAARREAERWLSARKTLRLWRQPAWSSDVRKCSLDGVRESVLHERVFDAPREKAREHAAWLYQHFRVQPGERLSGPSLLKRWGTLADVEGGVVRQRVASTSHMAARPWMVGAARFKTEVEAYLRLLRAELTPNIVRDELDVTPTAMGVWGHIDGSCLFPGRIDALVEEAGLADAVAGRLKAGLARLFRAVKSSPGEPLPYYAIVLADGDRMGEAINDEDTASAHRALSKALSRFAQEVESIAGKHGASVIYTGGDDVLALSPLHTVLDFADALRRAFSECVAVSKKPPTLSVGVAICHHLLPLGVSLEHARHAERLAKRERNSLGILLDKRSGPPIELSGRWDEETSAGNLAERLTLMADWHRAGAIPTRMGHELSQLAQMEEGLTPEARGAFLGVVRAEVYRILDRKQIKSRPAPSGAPVDTTQAQIVGLVRERAEGAAAALGREMVVAGLIADALAQSEPASPDEAQEVAQ
jgi:CRISPR-associated protein Cmr2